MCTLYNLSMFAFSSLKTVENLETVAAIPINRLMIETGVYLFLNLFEFRRNSYNSVQ